MVIFNGVPGRVLRIVDPAVPATISGPFKMEDWDGYGSFRAIVNRVTTSYGCNYQFMHTLGRSIYVYTFGDRIGQINVTGVAFNSDCSSGSCGLDAVRGFYQKNKVSVRPEPIKLSICGSTMLGMLVGIEDAVSDPEALMYPFSLNFALIPDGAAESAKSSSSNNNKTPSADTASTSSSDAQASSGESNPFFSTGGGGGSAASFSPNIAPALGDTAFNAVTSIIGF